MEKFVNPYKDEVEALSALGERYGKIRAEIAKQIVGQEDVVESIVVSIFSRGHALLVGVPGLAKTLLVQTLAKVLDLSFSRIQFTPDLMPSDITGSEILDQNRTYKFLQGPVSPIWCWLTKSTGPHPRPRLPFWKPCRKRK